MPIDQFQLLTSHADKCYLAYSANVIIIINDFQKAHVEVKETWEELDEHTQTFDVTKYWNQICDFWMELGYIFYYLSSSAHLVTNKNPESHQFYHQFSWLKKKIKFLIGPKRLFFPLSFNKS